VAGPDVTRLLSDKSITHYTAFKMTAQLLWFNLAPARPGSDIAVRQALITALDTKSYTLAANGGRGKAATSVVPTGAPCYDPGTAKLVPTPSVDKAKQILTSAGYTLSNGKFQKDGKALVVNLISDGTQGAGPEYIVNTWNQLGIGSTLQVNDQPTGLNRALTSVDYDATVFNLNTPLPIPGWQMVSKVTGAPSPKGGNFLVVSDPVLVTESNAAEATTGAESCKHWANFQQQLWKTWSVLPLDTDGYDYFVKGFDLNPSRMWLGQQPFWLGIRKLA
jgi:ABC-type transport system substrate-binding protein